MPFTPFGGQAAEIVEVEPLVAAGSLRSPFGLVI
jgi:hypothetical protein